MAKGGQFERLVCDNLSHWWTGGTTASVFWRTSNSGGRATIRKEKGHTTSNAHGDICSTDPITQEFMKVFCLELKRGYKDACLSEFLDATKAGGIKGLNQVKEWITKAERDRAAAGAANWMLVIRRDRRHEVLVMLLSTYKQLTAAGAVWSSCVGPILTLATDEGTYKAVRFSDWLKCVTPKHVKRIARSL